MEAKKWCSNSRLVLNGRVHILPHNWKQVGAGFFVETWSQLSFSRRAEDSLSNGPYSQEKNDTIPWFRHLISCLACAAADYQCSSGGKCSKQTTLLIQNQLHTSSLGLQRLNLLSSTSSCSCVHTTELPLLYIGALVYHPELDLKLWKVKTFDLCVRFDVDRRKGTRTVDGLMSRLISPHKTWFYVHCVQKSL